MIQHIAVHSLTVVYEHQNTMEKVQHIYVICIVLCRCWLCKWKIPWLSSPKPSHYTDYAILATQLTAENIQNHDIKLDLEV